MPTYEYQCLDCGDRFDVVQSFKDKTLKVHDTCGGGLQKVFHASGVVFKGSGYYVTDSRPSEASSSAASSGSDSTAASSGDSGKDSSKDPAKSEKSEKKTEKKVDKQSNGKAPSQPSAAAD